MSILTDVASCKSGLKAFDLLSDELDKKKESANAIENLYDFIKGNGSKGGYKRLLDDFLESHVHNYTYNKQWSHPVLGMSRGHGDTFGGRTGKKDAQASLDLAKKKALDDYNNLHNKSIVDTIELVRNKLKSIVNNQLRLDGSKIDIDVNPFIDDMIERLMTGAEDNYKFEDVVIGEYRQLKNRARQLLEVEQKKKIQALKSSDNEDYDSPIEPKWLREAGYDALVFDQEKAAKKIASWVKTLSESQVHNASSFSRALNQSKLSEWVVIERKNGRPLSFYMKNRGLRIPTEYNDDGILGLINTIMKMANQAIFDSVDGIDYFLDSINMTIDSHYD